MACTKKPQHPLSPNKPLVPSLSHNRRYQGLQQHIQPRLAAASSEQTHNQTKQSLRTKPNLTTHSANQNRTNNNNKNNQNHALQIPTNQHPTPQPLPHPFLPSLPLLHPLPLQHLRNPHNPHPHLHRLVQNRHPRPRNAIRLPNPADHSRVAKRQSRPRRGESPGSGMAAGRRDDEP